MEKVSKSKRNQQISAKKKKKERNPKRIKGEKKKEKKLKVQNKIFFENLKIAVKQWKMPKLKNTNATF